MGRISTKLLILIAFCSVVACILMAALISLVLPRYVTDPDFYQQNNDSYYFTDAIDICHCLTSVYPYGSKKKINFQHVDEGQKYYSRARRYVSSRRRQISDYLVALSVPTFHDDTASYMFACNGGIVASDQLIASTFCVNEASEWYDLIIRAESPFWSKLGKTYSVKSFALFSNRIALVTINGTFSPKLVSNSLKYRKFNKIFKDALEIGWDNLMYEQSLEKRLKFWKYEILDWTSSEECFKLKNTPCFDDADFNKMSSRLLIEPHSKILLGIQVDDGASDAQKLLSLLGNKSECFSITEEACKASHLIS